MANARPVSPIAAVAALAFLTMSRPIAQEGSQIRECAVVADDFTFTPARVDVHQNEIVRVTFRAVDIPHTFTIDDYRIAKRAGVGQTIIFEFRADRAGTFTIYCSLTADQRCRQMKGQLVVAP
jgi:heme/copper-type cytochrome/quinol oxidase subunit 2